MSLSLKQQLSNNTSNLQDQLNSLSSDVSSAVAFHKNIIHDDANIKALADRATANASDIDSLEATTLAQTGEIESITANVATNAQSIIDYNTQFQNKIDSEEARALAAELVNSQAVVTERSRAIGVEGGIADDIISLQNDKQDNIGPSTQLSVDMISYHDPLDISRTKDLNYIKIVEFETNVAGAYTAVNDEEVRALAAESVLTSRIATEESAARSAESSLNTAVITERDRAVGVEGLLSTRISSEASTARSAEGVLRADLVTATGLATSAHTEIVKETGLRKSDILAVKNTATINRLALEGADTTELNARVAADTAELNARVAEDKKMVFCHMMEFEGLMGGVVNDYPFASGYGSPSSAGFGLSVPFGYKLVGCAFSTVSTDTANSVVFQVQHFNEGSVVVDSVLVDSTLGSSHYKNELFPSAVAKPAGNICVKVVSASGCVDPNARYRVSFYLQSQLGF